MVVFVGILYPRSQHKEPGYCTRFYAALFVHGSPAWLARSMGAGAGTVGLCKKGRKKFSIAMNYTICKMRWMGDVACVERPELDVTSQQLSPDNAMVFRLISQLLSHADRFTFAVGPCGPTVT
jgi:hypothetical protein